MIFVFTFVLVVTLLYTPATTFSVKNRANDLVASCTDTGKNSPDGAGLRLVKCCWWDYDDQGESTYFCSTCEDGGTRGKINCTDPVVQSSFQPSTRPPFGLQNPGDLENIPMLEQEPRSPLQTPPTVDQGILPESEVLEQQSPDQGLAAPQTTEKTQSATVEEEPVCPKNQVFDKKSGGCIDDETEQTQQSEEGQNKGDSISDNNNNNNK